MTSAERPSRKTSKKSTNTKGAITKKAATKKSASTKPKATKDTKKRTTKVTKKSTSKATKAKTLTKAATKKLAKTAKRDSKKSKATTPKRVRGTTPKSRTKKTKKEKVERDQQEVVITDVEDNVEKLLRDNVAKELLIELLVCNNVKIAKSTKKDAVVKTILDESANKGESVVRERLSKETAGLVVSELKGSEPNAPNNKGELQKEMKELISSFGSFSEALKKLNVSTVDKICEDLGFTEDGTAEEKVEGLLEETSLLGVRQLFDRTTYNYVKEVAGKAGLSIKGQREHLIARFLGQAHRPWLVDAVAPPKEKGEKKEKAPGPNIADIKSGISDLDLYQYFVKDLENYISQHGLRKGQNKKEMVKIIRSFLKGDQSVLASNTPKKVRGGKRKRETEQEGSNKRQKTDETA